MTRIVLCSVLALMLALSTCLADRGQIIGTVICARSNVPVPTHPVMLIQGRETIARTLTDKLGKFRMEFAYSPGKPLVVKAGPSSGYLEAQGAVEPDTDVTISVMPAWATILGIVTDRDTGRGLPDITVRAGRGDKPIPDAWATTTTDATGVYVMKVKAFENDDVTKPLRDLWLEINGGDNPNMNYALVKTDPIPLWAWPDPTQPTRVEVSLPGADAKGLTIADVVAIKVPEALQPAGPSPVGGGEAPPTGPPSPSGPTGPPAGECIVACPHCGQKFRVSIEAVQ